MIGDRTIEYRVSWAESGRILGYERIFNGIWQKRFEGEDAWQPSIHSSVRPLLRDQFIGKRDKNGTKVYDNDELLYRRQQYKSNGRKNGGVTESKYVFWNEKCARWSVMDTNNCIVVGRSEFK
jgi:hypothetical protein